MAVSKDKKRLVVTLDKKFAEEIEEAAKKEYRSVSNYLETLLYLAKGKKEKKGKGKK